MASLPPRRHLGDPVELLLEHIERGGILALPTESSYGLGADPASAEGVAEIYRLKGREAGKPLPVVAANLEQLAALGIDPESPAVRALASLWPAALTCVLPTRFELPAAAGRREIAVRIPAHEGLRDFLARLGRPLTATSANLSGAAPVHRPDEVERLLGDARAVLIDGGVLPGGPPSTLIRFREGGEVEVIRQGRVPAERIIGVSRLLREEP